MKEKNANQLLLFVETTKDKKNNRTKKTKKKDMEKKKEQKKDMERN